MNKRLIPPPNPQRPKYIHTKEFFHPHWATPPLALIHFLSKLIIFFSFSSIQLFSIFLIVITRHRLNTTIICNRIAKKREKVLKFNKNTLSTLSDPPPLLGLSIFFKLIIFTLRIFFYPHARTPHCLSTIEDPPPLINKMWIICYIFWNPSLR